MGPLSQIEAFGSLGAGLLAFAAITLAAGGLWLKLSWRSRRTPMNAAESGFMESLRLGLPPGVLVVVIDHAGRIQFASQKALSALGLPEADMLRGKAFTGLPCWDEPPEARHALARAILKAEMGRSQQLAVSFRSGPADRHFLFELHPQVRPDGARRAVVITAMEMSSLLAAVPSAFTTHRNAMPTALEAGRGEPSFGLARKETATARDALVGPADAGAAAKSLVDSMFKLLPTAKSADEALRIVASYLARLFPGTSGKLFMQKKGASGLHGLRSWGQAASGGSARISADDCWAMRHNELHWVENPDVDLCCGHNPSGQSACTPLIVRGETVGVLTVAWSEAAPERALLESLAEPLAQALAQTMTNLALREQATRDPLTGLLNRQVLDAEFQRLIQRAQEDSEPASLLMIDIDHFKAFNDRFGHDAGDLVLKSVASRINQAVRSRDLAFRFGGEEIMVLLPSCGTEEAIISATRMQKGLTELTLVNRGERLPPVTISIGVATFPNDAVTPEGLFQVADAGVYAAKAAGRNAIVHPVATARAA